MVSASSKRAFKKTVKFGQLLKVIPFSWDDSSDMVIYSNSRLQTGFWRFIVLYLYFQAGYQLRIVIKESGDPNVPFDSYLKLVLHFVSRLIGLLFHTFWVFQGRKMAHYIQQFFVLNDRFKEKYMSAAAEDKIKRCSRIMHGFVYFTVLQPVPVALTYVGEFRDRKYWQSVTIPHNIYPYFVPLCALDEYIISVFSIISAIVMGTVMYTTVIMTNIWTSQLRSVLFSGIIKNSVQLKIIFKIMCSKFEQID
ncbi:unnamed protein product [Allacma fusca]|uniref:Uncharacterized protein n=1 Tax=Allacma fusca TaxID=39272 RepID=A0A8J2PIA5_9HEXA|nr:unnamed protein product [Allacma fusca]